ncbi:hypothetical protein B0O80DRAFT_519814 [Mortierella sp. GBAus27b]|nr:hypothetical protein BGX31_003392 [Mortierella sp. GBA43]KAI8358992.1 hypothetical protein B0O80DRAFT_519814 [Mortierella sp. GBAus27b]
MEATQSFRLTGCTDILEIPCDQDDGQNVIFWDTILEAFPEALYVKNGNTLVRKMKDSGPDRGQPQRIKHYPGVVLDVVLSGSISSNPAMSPIGHSRMSRVGYRANDLHGTSADEHVIEDLGIATLDAGRQIVSSLQEREPQSVFDQRLAAFLPPDMQAQVLASSDIHGSIVKAIQDGQVDSTHEKLIACLEHLNKLMSDLKVLALRNNDLMTDVKDLTIKNMELTGDVKRLQEAFDAKQEEMKKLQVQALSQLSLLQNRVQALMTQTYELHEYPIPRLFVILPQDTSSWNPANLFSNKFRLYFLCECGEHTMSNDSKTQHHIHLAKHEGYEIRRPTEFFKQYGSYVLTILKMLKFGIAAAGVAIPAVGLLVRADALSQVTGSLKILSGNLEKGIDQAISCLEKATAKNGVAADELSGQLENNEALEGADLRKLESFLNHKDGNKVLGNLFRTVTPEGHVKWVCIDHYRVNYQEKAAKEFNDTVASLGGTFDENVGRVEVKLLSRLQAEQFYQALEKARSVYELRIALDWETTLNDFKRLRNIVLQSNIGALEIDLTYQEGPANVILNRNKRYDPIFNIMRHPSIRSIEILRAPKDFIERSSLLSRNNDFPNLKHIGVDLNLDTMIIKTLLSKSPNLFSLAFNGTDRFTTADNADMEPLGDVFESAGHVRIHIRPKIRILSRTDAERVYGVLEKAKSLHGIDINLQVDLTQSDIERLRGILSNTGTMKIKLHLSDSMASTVSDRAQQYDSIFDVMRHPSMHSMGIMSAPRDFFEQSSLLPQSDGFPGLRHMEIGLTGLKSGIPNIKCLIAKAQNLSSLEFKGLIDGNSLLRLYTAIAEHQTYPITFSSWWVRIPSSTEPNQQRFDRAFLGGPDHAQLCIPPLTEPNQQLLPHQYLAHLLSVEGLEINELFLEGRTDEEAIVDAYAKVERRSTGLTKLIMRGVLEGQEDQFIQDVARIVSLSELRTLVIDMGKKEEGRARILDSIQWKHIRDLEIEMDKESVGIHAMRALVEGRSKEKGSVELSRFGFQSDSSEVETVLDEKTALLRSFVASTSIKSLRLGIHVAPSDMESVLNAMDVSRLESIVLRTIGYSADEVDGVLDCLARARNLRHAYLSGSLTQEQHARMQEKGISLHC